MIAANRIEMVSTVADIIDFADMAKSGFKFFKNIKENGIHHYFRKMQFKTKNGKVSWDTFKNGSKALIQNIKTIKTEVLDKTTTGRLFDYYKKEHNLDTLYDIMDGIGKVDKLNDWINDKTKKKTPDYNFGGI